MIIMARINPSKPTEGNILQKSPILGTIKQRNKETLSEVTKPNLKNIGKSITPTTRSTPYGKGY